MARIRLGQVVSETAPPAGQISVYAKTDDSLYLQTPSGLEKLLIDSSSAAAYGYKVEYFTLDIGDILAKEVILAEAPAFPIKTLLTVDGAPTSFYTLDFTVGGNVLTWSGTRLDGLLEPGDVLQVVYV